MRDGLAIRRGLAPESGAIRVARRIRRGWHVNSFGEVNHQAIVSSHQDDTLNELNAPPFQDETPQFDFLPNLAERRATLQRANQALERARVLLERIQHLDVGTVMRQTELLDDAEQEAKAKRE